MALVLADRVQETTTTSGTGTVTLNGAVPGFQDFVTGIGSGNITYYTLYDPTSYEWEVGIGTFTSSGSDTLSRDTVLSNSLGTTAKINFAGNQTSVFVTYPTEKSVNLNADGVAEIGGPISYADTGLIATFTSTEAGYNQIVVQNKSSATNASANINISNDTSTSTTGFAELGINSSTFTGSGSFNIPSAAYLASAGTDLTIGTYSAHDVHIVTNSNATDAMTIFDNGGSSLGGYANPGIGNLAVNKIVSGVSTITASAGTTILNAASTYYQEVVGTTTQTIRLPDATTLLNGTTFIVDNNSTSNVTVTDNASASIEVIPTGGLSYIYLVSNSTIAGTWTVHGFLPSIYNFNNTTADFGNATITNAVWNGTTIASGFGGTGLTSFGAANYALYSTSSSTLVAGTLPIAAGGTGEITRQAAMDTLAGAVTSGQYLRGNGTDVVMSAIQAADVPTLNQNTTGSAGSVANALTAGTGITYSSGTTYNGSAAITISIPQAITTTSSVQFGSLGIGTAASGTSGEIRATNNITAYFSDDRFKINLGNIPNALAKVQTLNGFYYEVNELAQSYGYEKKLEVGVSAQQVQAIMPEVVAPAPIDENYLTVRYERLVPLLIEAIKELKVQVDELKKVK